MGMLTSTLVICSVGSVILYYSTRRAKLDSNILALYDMVTKSDAARYNMALYDQTYCEGYARHLREVNIPKQRSDLEVTEWVGKVQGAQFQGKQEARGKEEAMEKTEEKREGPKGKSKSQGVQELPAIDPVATEEVCREAYIKQAVPAEESFDAGSVWRKCPL